MKAKLETLETRQCVTLFEARIVDDIKGRFSEHNDENRKTHDLPPLKFLNDVVKAFNKDPTPLTKYWNYVNNVVGKLKTVGNLVAHPELTDESLEKVRVKKLINHAVTAVKGRYRSSGGQSSTPRSGRRGTTPGASPSSLRASRRSSGGRGNARRTASCNKSRARNYEDVATDRTLVHRFAPKRLVL
jgi:hypothetical protein